MGILKRYEYDKPENKTEKLVFEFLNELIGRKGFWEWWESIDDTTKIDILESLAASIGKIH